VTHAVARAAALMIACCQAWSPALPNTCSTPTMACAMTRLCGAVSDAAATLDGFTYCHHELKRRHRLSERPPMHKIYFQDSGLFIGVWGPPPEGTGAGAGGAAAPRCRSNRALPRSNGGFPDFFLASERSKIWDIYYVLRPGRQEPVSVRDG